MVVEPKLHFNASYEMTSEPGGYRFQFRCAYCGRGHATGLIQADSVEAAYGLAADEARRYFNGCLKCGVWVCDSHYNEDEMMCLKCAPR